MKKLTQLFVFALVIFFPIFAVAETATLYWEYGDPLPDRYELYMRTPDGVYDYDNPVVIPAYGTSRIPGDVLSVDIEITVPLITPLSATDLVAVYNKENSTLLLTWAQTLNKNSQTYLFVIRAAGEDDQGNKTDESGDSNEASKVFTTDVPVIAWKIFYSETSGGPWTELDLVENIGQDSPQMTVPLTVVPDGEAKRIYFTIVTFSSDTLFSSNSEEVSEWIDRRPAPTPPVNLTCGVLIPVE